ncbi:peptidoglycan bridge formation glycyltransferase FemA/FemB family protein [Candidatus Dojkabacteria bacterium]|nr:peptidoglycan bridge formation glycyltransferase FemA/FemB family protein [Candidatus Dojkabacteria bacterium]
MYSIKPIQNKEIWEEFIASSSGEKISPTTFIQSWSWGEFLVKQGQKTYRLGIFDDDELIGIALGTKIEARRGKYLHFRHGPVMDWSNDRLIEFVISELKKLAIEEKVWFVRISPQIKKIPNSLKSRSTASPTHDVDSEQTWILDLSESEGELLAGMRKNTRYSIKKAEKDGVEILKTTNSEYLKDFWEIYRDTVNRQKWSAYTFDYIKNEFETFAENDQTLLLLAKYQGKFIAGAIFIFYNNQTVYHHSGSLTEYRKIPASYLIQWEAIKEGKARGMKKHNFWGLPLDQNDELQQKHPWTGLGLFKVGFGGEAERWIHARDLAISPKYWLTYIYERVEKIKRGYK